MSKRKAPRISIEHRFHLVHAEGPGGNLAVLNLSEGGLGVEGSPALASLKMGDCIDLKVTLLGKVMPIRARMAHRTQGCVGFEFQFEGDAALDFKVQLRDYFQTELAGLKLEPVRGAALQKPERGTAHWWTGGSRGDEVYLVEDGGELLEFHMTFLGNYAEWSQDKRAVSYGVLKADPSEGPLTPKRSALVLRPVAVSETVPELAARFLGAVPGIPAQFIAEISRLIAKR